MTKAELIAELESRREAVSKSFRNPECPITITREIYQEGKEFAYKDVIELVNKLEEIK